MGRLRKQDQAGGPSSASPILAPAHEAASSSCLKFDLAALPEEVLGMILLPHDSLVQGAIFEDYWEKLAPMEVPGRSCHGLPKCEA